MTIAPSMTRKTAVPAVALTLSLALGVLACGPSEEVQKQIAELQAVSAEKDSLLSQVTENSLLLSRISAELASAQAPATTASETSAPDPDAILQDIHDLTSRLNDSETRLAESQKRIRALTKDVSGRDAKLTSFEKTVANLQTAMDNQRQTIASLTEQVDNLQRENVRLVTDNTQLTETVSSMTDEANTAWYVIGTKQELLDKGIIAEQGGSRVLFVFGKRGKTLVPARDIDLDQLNRIDVTQITTIPLPDPTAEYAIVSLQDLSGLDSTPDDNGRFTGDMLRIADPTRFWANNRVLVVIQS